MKNFYSNLEEKDLELPMIELYHNKSKQIHHSFNGIREFYNTQIKKNDTLIGYGALILKEDETYEETVIVK